MDKLVIENLEGADIDLSSFGKFLAQRIRVNIYEKVTSNDRNFQKRLSAFDDFLNGPQCSNLQRQCYGIKEFNIRQIIMQALANLKCNLFDGICQIEVNRNAVIPGTFIKFFTICQLVDAGNTLLPGTQLITNCYKEIEENCGFYVDMYLSGGATCP